MSEVEQRQMPMPSEWMSRWFEDWPFSRWRPDLWRGRLLEGTEPIRVEEFREDDTLVVKAEIPGIDPDRDVEIAVSDGSLRIRAERKQESTTEEKDSYRTELSYGSFSRVVPLPAGASEDDVKASYHDGILEVRIPIDRGKAEARKVPVQRT